MTRSDAGITHLFLVHSIIPSFLCSIIFHERDKSFASFHKQLNEGYVDVQVAVELKKLERHFVESKLHDFHS